MGNRCVITASREIDVAKSSDIGVYLHWNGGRDSVEAFLEYCKLKGYRSPEKDCYGWVRLCQVIGNFFGGTSSVGIEKCYNLDCDNWDNGVYIIENWEIIGRQYFDGVEQYNYDLTEMLVEIDRSMPEDEQLGEEFLKAEEVPINSLKIGDKVFFINKLSGKIEIREVIGIGEKGKFVNGHDVTCVPYINRYGNEYNNNINNYLFQEAIRKAE